MRIKVILTIACLVTWQSLWAAALQNNTDGTISDLVTALTWQQEDDNNTRNHADAIAYCQNLTLAGKNNWRLPNVKELTSIVDFHVLAPSIDRAIFLNTAASYYWSASSVASNSSNAWVVYFLNGVAFSGNKTSNYYVRCVR